MTIEERVKKLIYTAWAGPTAMEAAYTEQFQQAIAAEREACKGKRCTCE